MGVLPWAILGSTIAAAAIGFGLSRLMMARPPRRPKPCGRRAPRWTCPGCGRNNGWARGTCPGCGVQRPAWTCRCHNFTNPAGTVRCQCMQH